jgi:putative hemolysin
MHLSSRHAEESQQGFAALRDVLGYPFMIGFKKTRRAVILATATMALALAGCRGDASSAAVERANPASENCAANGGRLVIESAGDGGQYGVCLFEDNRQCEEWALLRGA